MSCLLKAKKLKFVSPFPASPVVTLSVKTVSSAQVCSRAGIAILEKDRVSVGPV